MAIIPLPPQFKVRRVTWNFDDPAQQNRSIYSGARKVSDLPGAARFSASVELVTKIGQANVLALRGFMFRLKGPRNSFRLPAVEADQIAVEAACEVFGDTAAGATSMIIRGAAGLPQLVAGETLMVNGQPLRLTMPSVAGVGADLRQVTFGPPLDQAAGHTARVEISAVWVSPAAAAGATSMTIYGPNGERQFLAGEMLTANDQLLTLTADSVSGGGVDNRVVEFEAPLRQAAIVAVRIERVRPTCLVALASSRVSWSVDPGQVYQVATIEVEEAF